MTLHAIDRFTSWRRSAFTLIELLVVISIIAILLAVGAASYTTAQQKARDATRRGDMRAIQNGFEQYYSSIGSYENNCATMATTEILPGGIPTDPKPSVGAYATSCTLSTYCACALLENEVGNSDTSGCGYDGSGDEEYFCVSNQQ